MANVDDWPVYVLEFSKDTGKEDIAWLIKFLTDYGLLLTASTPSPGYVSNSLCIVVLLMHSVLFSSRAFEANFGLYLEIHFKPNSLLL